MTSEHLFYPYLPSRQQGGIHPCLPTGLFRWGSKNEPYGGLIFWKFLLKFAKKVMLNGPEIAKFSQIFEKGALREGTDFFILVFCDLTSRTQRNIPYPQSMSSVQRGFVWIVDLNKTTGSIGSTAIRLRTPAAYYNKGVDHFVSLQNIFYC